MSNIFALPDSESAATPVPQPVGQPQTRNIFAPTPEEQVTEPGQPLEEPKPGLLSELGKEIGGYFKDTAHTLKKLPLGAPLETLNLYKIALKTKNPRLAAHAYIAGFREGVGAPISEAEARTLAEDMAAYNHELGNTGKLRQYLRETFGGGKTAEESRQTLRGGVNLAMLGIDAATGGSAGYLPLMKAIPGATLKKLAAMEAHGIASLVSWNVAQAAVEKENLAKAAKEGVIGGALAPALGPVANLGMKGALGLGMLATDIARVPVGLTDRALRHVTAYEAARNFLGHGMSSLRDWVARSGEGALESMGLHGISRDLAGVRSAAYMRAAQWNATISDALVPLRGKKNSEERRLLGEMLHLDDDEAFKAAQFAEASGRSKRGAHDLMDKRAVIQGVLREVATEAEKHGVTQIDAKTGGLRYFVARQDFGMPHVFVNTEQFIKPGKIRTEAIRVLMDEHGMSQAKAQKVLAEIHQQTTAAEANNYRGMSYINLKGRRYNLPGYEADPSKVIPDYLMNMAKRIENHRAFSVLGLPSVQGGAGLMEQFPRAYEPLKDLADPDQVKLAKNIISDQLGAFDRGDPVSRFFTKTMQSQAIEKLGFGQINQTTQFITPNIMFGWRRSAEDFIRMMADPEMHERLARSGGFLETLLRAHRQEMFGVNDGGWLGKTAEARLRQSGFTKMDLGARIYSAMRGWTEAHYLADQLRFNTENMEKGALGKLTEQRIAKIKDKFAQLGLDADEIVKRGGFLTEEEGLKAAQTLSTKVNFWGDALSVPRFFRTPWGRILMQFKSFGYQQSRLMKQHVVDPALRGDTGPLIRALIAQQASGEVINDVRAIGRLKPRTDAGIVRLLNNYAAGSSFGILGDMFRAASKPGAIAGFALGPQASDIGEVGYGLMGHPRFLAKKAVAIGVPYIPWVGPTIAPAVGNVLFPPEQQ